VSADRHTLAEILDVLAADPDTGCEWRMDYRARRRLGRWESLIRYWFRWWQP
jgi:hypothetical protein